MNFDKLRLGFFESLPMPAFLKVPGGDFVFQNSKFLALTESFPGEVEAEVVETCETKVFWLDGEPMVAFLIKDETSPPLIGAIGVLLEPSYPGQTGVAEVDAEGRIRSASSGLARMVGVSEPELLGRDVCDVLDPAMRSALAKLPDADRIETEAHVQRGDGSEANLWLTLSSAGTEGAFYLAARDTNAPRSFEGDLDRGLQMLHEMRTRLAVKQRMLEEANAQLTVLATTDGLTGLLNHREFHDRLAAQVHMARRYDDTFSLLMIDVDLFKSYNDSFGHPAGDELLKNFADILRAHVRTTDSLARYGGEEFAIILPRTDRRGAIGMAERLRRAISESDIGFRPVTASFGIASYDLEASADDVLKEADRALYEAKSRGRNLVCSLR